MAGFLWVGLHTHSIFHTLLKQLHESIVSCNLVLREGVD